MKYADVHDPKVNVFTGPIFNNNNLSYKGKSYSRRILESSYNCKK